MTGKEKDFKHFRKHSIFYRTILGWTFAALTGMLGFFFHRLPDFSRILAAQLTFGIIGLVGGLSYAWGIRAADVPISCKPGIFLALIWSVCFVLGGTPLFLTSGTTIKIAVLTFYSFALAGAAGAIATTRLVKPLLTDPEARDTIPAVVILSFSIGLAVMASNLTGELLQPILHPAVAWVIALAAMSLIIGGGGAYAIIRLGQTVVPNSRDDVCFSPSASDKTPVSLIVLILLTVPFYLNDFADIYIRDWRVWLTIDYIAVKLFPCLVVFAWLHQKKMNLSELGFRRQDIASFFTILLIGVLAALFIEQNGYLVLTGMPGYQHLGRMPVITNSAWHWFDLTLGLMMVGLCEEMVFRGYLSAFLSQFTKSATVIIAVSAVAFGLIHWSGGLEKVIVTAAIGAIFMALYLRTKALPAIAIAHAVLNFINATEIISPSIFRFL